MSANYFQYVDRVVVYTFADTHCVDQMSSDEAILRREKVFIQKMDLLLVQVRRHLVSGNSLSHYELCIDFKA